MIFGRRVPGKAAAARRFAVAPEPDVLAVTDDGRSLSVATASGVVKITCAQNEEDSSSFNLVAIYGRDGRRDLMATGSILEMQALRDGIAQNTMATLRRRRGAPSAITGIALIAAFTAGIYAGTPSFSPTMPMLPLPAKPGPSGTSGGQVDAGQLAAKVRDALANAAPGTPGAINRPEKPVSLDGTPPAQAATPQPAPPATAPAPRADAGKPVEPLVASAAPATPAAGQAEAPSPEQVRQLRALQAIKTKIDAGEQVPPEMIAELPPETALKMASALTARNVALAVGRGRVVSLPPDVVAQAHTDSFGIPDIPETNSWAATGGRVPVALPGGGDIRSAADMVRFGLPPI